MARSLLSCILCLLLAVAAPGGSRRFAQASASIRKSSTTTQRRISAQQRTAPKYGIDSEVVHFITQTNTTNTTNATVPTQAPTPDTPTPAPTHEPTKRYESPEDEERDEEQQKGAKVGIIFLWIVFVFAIIWMLVYFRDAIFFFFGNAWNNTRRYGCRGCLKSFFPCVFGNQPGGGSEPLDQIIFETEDPNAPLMT